MSIARHLVGVLLGERHPGHAQTPVMQQGSFDMASGNLRADYSRALSSGPREDTRQTCLRSPDFAYAYALNVDKMPRDDTRAAASQQPEWAYRYATEVDKQAHPVTREGVQGTQWQQWYADALG